MKKKLIALAIAGLAPSAAFAQTPASITLYGLADVYMQSSNNTGYSQSGLASGGMSGSRWGLKGTEDLGNGLSAVFTYESAVAVDTGASTGFARQAFAGLSSNTVGSITFGRQLNPTYHLLANTIDTQGYSSFSVVNAALGDTSRTSNSIVYTSPNFSGFTGRAMYGFGEAPAAPKDTGNVFGLNLTYANGPATVGLIYHRVNADAAAASGDNKWTTLGGAYDFGVAKLTAAYQRENAFTAAPATNLKHKNWTFGLSAPVGKAGTAALQYAKANPDGGSNDTKGWNLLYSHAMSKRTNLYAGYARSTGDVTGASSAGGAANANGVAWTLGAQGTAAGTTDKVRTTFAGMRHTF